MIRCIKLFFLLVVMFCSILSTAQSPLALFSNEWNDVKYAKAFTATHVKYMSDEEKKVIHILNLMRLNPLLFLKSVVMKYPNVSMNPSFENSSYFKSLITTLQNQQPLPVFTPDEKCYNSANCHALISGTKSYVGHDRLSSECKSRQYFSGECCSYGYSTALDIVLTLLIDEDVPSLGHRYALLGPYKNCGVSIQPHRKYGFNAVIDFQY